MIAESLLWALLATAGADTASSLVSFSKGGREINPLVVSTHPAPFTAQVMGVAVVEVLVLRKIAKTKPRLAKTLAMIQIGGSTAATINNAYVIRKQNEMLARR